MKAQFSMIKFQETVVAKLVEIEYHGHGLHKQRSRGALAGKTREALLKRGYSKQDVMHIWKDCKDMAALQIICDEAEDAA